MMEETAARGGERERLLMRREEGGRRTRPCVCFVSLRLHYENKYVLPIVLTLVIDTSVIFLLQIIVGNTSK